MEHRRDELDLLLVALGQLLGPPAREVLGRGTARSHGRRLAPRDVRRHALEAREEDELVQDPHPRVQPALLRQVAPRRARQQVGVGAAPGDPALVGASRTPRVIRIVVVLPAPFAPRKPNTWPGGTSNDEVVEGDDGAEALGEVVDDKGHPAASIPARMPRDRSSRGRSGRAGAGYDRIVQDDPRTPPSGSTRSAPRGPSASNGPTATRPAMTRAPPLAVSVRVLPGRGGMPGWLDTNPTLTGEQTRLVDVALVGDYALQPTWGDGHPTGYHTYMLLRERCPCEALHAPEREARVLAASPATGAGTPLAWRARMIIATTPYIAGYRVGETKGQVFGLVVRSRGLGGNFVAGLRSIVGGEIHEYTSLLEDTRRQAIDRMVQNATLVGGNAVDVDALRRVRARPGRCPRSSPTGPPS